MTAPPGTRICPGQWRPHYTYEHVAWIRPPWPGEDYLWLDFPEAVFADGRLLFLGHFSPRFPAAFPDLPAVAWERCERGIRFRRVLPNGVAFGAKAEEAVGGAVDLELSLENGSQGPLGQIRFQTCAYLRAMAEFNAPTNWNKYVHAAGGGWTPLPAAEAMEDRGAAWRVGWRGGPAVADRPAIACVSASGRRVIAFTWGADTYSLIGNPAHPCLHADPAMADLAAGERRAIRGRLLFLEGGLEELEQAGPW